MNDYHGIVGQYLYHYLIIKGTGDDQVISRSLYYRFSIWQ